MINPFLKIHNEKWVVPVSILSGVLGFMMVVSWINDKNRVSRVSFLPPEQRQRVLEGTIDLAKYFELQEEVSKLQKKNDELAQVISNNGKGSEQLNDQLSEIKVFAGLTELEGPGVLVTLKDNPAAGPMPAEPDIIHDYDLRKVINELLSAGAEAISVNGQRFVSTSSIRCAGPTILVDDVKVAPPFQIYAIGNPDVLYSGFTINGGVVTELSEANPEMVKIEKVKKIKLPAFLGATGKKYAKPIEPQNGKAKGSQS